VRQGLLAATLPKSGYTLAFSLAALLVFSVSATIGYFFPSEPLVKEVSGKLFYSELPASIRIFAIYLNNMFFAFVLLLASLTVILGFYLLAFNGYLVGSFIALASRHIPLHALLIGVLPYGVLELIAYSYIVGSTMSMLMLLREGGMVEDALHGFVNVYARSAFILLAAAVVETITMGW